MILLHGPWQIETDAQNVGRDAGWFRRGPGASARPTPVPGLIQQVFPGYHGVAWYWTRFASPRLEGGERCLLRFGAVDYLAEVWVNGVAVGGHEGGETPFTLDVTAALHAAGDADNLLGVRVLNPTDEPIDGIVLGQTAHRNKRAPYSIGWSFNRGGVVQAVERHVAPALRVTDVFARPEGATGVIRLHITVQNDLPASASGSLTGSVAAATGGNAIASATQAAHFPPGETVLESELRVLQPRLWDLDSPTLYRVTVALEGGRSAEGAAIGAHQYSLRCGFRELRVADGYFRLNGRRLFLRCSHTGNDWPSGMDMARSAGFLRRDLLYAKAAGFNTIRFIAGMATPDQLDFCDELGLMVYEEAYSSWCMEDSPRLAERFDRANAEMIRRDRNHPSVVIWGLLNETMDGPVFRHAVDTLPLVRSLDDSRLVFLNTGRMDCELGIGSVSNPGSHSWEHVWGGEAPGAGRYENLKEPHTFGGYPGGYFERVGDAHMYPSTPHTAETIRFLRTLGQDTRPVYIGEYGIASTVNAIRVTRLFEQQRPSFEPVSWLEGRDPGRPAPGATQPAAAGNAAVEDGAFYRAWAEQFAADWRRYGMEEVTPFPEDILRRSQQLHGAQRLLGLNAIRSNPKICGYNLTGTVDQGMTAEGLWTTWREFKPGVLDAVAEGLAPLRWCLFAEPLQGYRGQPFKLDVVLANEDALPPGDYPVVIRVFGPAGCAWERSLTLTIPAQPEELPLAIPVLSEEVAIDGPAGTYVLAAEMTRGGAPAGGRTAFYLGDRATLPRISAEIVVWEDTGRLSAWVAGQDVVTRPFAAPRAELGHAGEVILVGEIPRSGADAAAWQELYRRMAGGASVLFITPQALRRGDDAVGWLPLAEKGRCDIFYNSIYHREDVGKRHPIFDGLPTQGILDWGYYREIIPDRLFQGQETPDEVIVAAFAVGYTCPEGYTSGVVMGVYPFGAGRFLVNTMRVLENLGTHPVADRLLANMIAWAAHGR